MIQKHILGRYGEDRAAAHLSSLGYEIIDRNWRCRSGEIDLIARDQDQIVFVEVKTRNGNGFGHPFEAISNDKLTKLRKSVAEWCRAKQLSGVVVRLDAVSVLVSGGSVQIEHLKQVF
jgi:putative endonuclease